MAAPIRLLLVEDNADDVQLNLAALRGAGLEIEWTCVETEADYRAGLARDPDLVISDHAMPAFSAPRALEILQETATDIPFIVVSGAIGEAAAVAIMRSGADDYVLKDNLARLAPAVERSLANAATRRRRRAAEQALRDSENRLRVLVDAGPECIKLIDAQGVIKHINAAGVAMLECDSRPQLVGQNFIQFVVAEYRAEYLSFIQRVLGGERGTLAYELIGCKGGRRWMDTHAVPIELENNEWHVLSITRDITEQRRSEERIQYMAYFDTLTGLPNRALLHDRLQRALYEAERRRQQVAVLFLDLDRFKNVNDSLGHASGDLLLKAVAERLNDLVRHGDTVARLGGDEITIVLSAITNEDDIQHVARKIRRAFERPFLIDGQELFITASLGVAVYPRDGRDAHELLRNADAAMYRAKEMGRDTIQIYSAELTAQVSQSLALENALRSALERGQLRLLYQPVVSLRSGRVIATEALLRWEHPELGLIPPGQFVPIAEETGLIMPIGNWVLNQACRQAQEWRSAGLPLCRVSVNVSARQTRDPELLDTIRAALAGNGMDPDCLSLELTETDLMQTKDTVLRNLRHLVAMGVKVLVDDFGTGYSSLSYLRRFPVHTLKIDRTFINGLSDDPGDAAITCAIINLAHSLNLTVVAEGVENADQLRFVLRNRCETVQGNYFSPPVSADQLGMMLERPFPIEQSH